MYNPKALREVRRIAQECNACAFDSDGKCRRDRRYDKMNMPSYEKGCCSFCFGNKGYFSRIENLAGGFKEVKDLFKKEVGFLTPKGCSIPWYKRSIICKSFHCPCAQDQVRKCGKSWEFNNAYYKMNSKYCKWVRKLKKDIINTQE